MKINGECSKNDFPLRRRFAVCREDFPGVARMRSNLVRTHIDHRLDGENHAGSKRHFRAALRDVADPRVFVELQPAAVAANFAHDAVAVRAGMVVDRLPNVAQ